MYNRIESFLDDFEIMYELQYGFRKRHSTNHALLNIIEQIRKCLDNKTYACGVFVDLEKAFDTVNHSILLSKLDHYGIRGKSNIWMRSYLSNRSQYVSINGSPSPKLEVSCGVPQGSILGPLLFLIYINDMHNALQLCVVHHFADDTNLLYSNKDPKIIKKVMNNELKLLFEWLCANRLSLNVGKTEFIIFRPPKRVLHKRIILSLNRKNIYESPKIKYLGLILDSRLTWSHHINELSKKLNRAVGMLYKIREFCPKIVLRSLYFSIFNSHLNYGIPVWGNADQHYMHKLVLLQKKAIRAITFSDFKAHSSPLFKDMNILKINDIYECQLASLMWDYEHNTLPNSLFCLFKKRNEIHNYNTRSAHAGKLSVNKSNTKRYGLKSFHVQGSKILNNLLDEELYKESKSKSSFLRNFKKRLLENY